VQSDPPAQPAGTAGVRSPVRQLSDLPLRYSRAVWAALAWPRARSAGGGALHPLATLAVTLLLMLPLSAVLLPRHLLAGYDVPPPLDGVFQLLALLRLEIVFLYALYLLLAVVPVYCVVRFLRPRVTLLDLVKVQGLLSPLFAATVAVLAALVFKTGGLQSSDDLDASVLPMFLSAGALLLAAYLLVRLALEYARAAGLRFEQLFLLLAGIAAAAALLPGLVAGKGLASNWHIPSGSMIPTLSVGDVVLSNDTVYDWKPVSRGDIIIYSLDGHPDVAFTSRIVGLGGDRVAYRAGRLYLNGAAVERAYLSGYDYAAAELQVGDTVSLYEESFAAQERHRIIETTDRGRADDTPEFLVPEGQYFVLGDNRDNALDSRLRQEVHRFVRLGDIKGKVYLRISPAGNEVVD